EHRGRAVGAVIEFVRHGELQKVWVGRGAVSLGGDEAVDPQQYGDFQSSERQVIVREYGRLLTHRSRRDGLARATMLGRAGLRRTVVPPSEHHQLPRAD